MRIKVFTFLVISILGFTSLFAQKTGIKLVNYKYSLLPTDPLPSDFTTYSASITTTGSEFRQLGLNSSGLVSSKFALRNFKKLNQGGHFHIAATVDAFQLISSETKTEEKKTKKDGKELVTKSYYKEVVYYMPVSIKVEDYKGQVLYEQTRGGANEPTSYILKNGKSNFNSLKELNNAWKSGTTVYNKLKSERIHGYLDSYARDIKRMYDVQEATGEGFFRLPKGKKVAAADTYEKHHETIKNELPKMTASGSLEPTKKALAPVISFWESDMKNYSASDKKEAKIVHANLFNLALINLILDDVEAAEKYVNECSKIEHKESETQRLVESIANRKNMFAVNKTNSTHFSIDLNNAESPEGADYSHLSKMTGTSLDESKTFEGSVVTNKGENLKGEFIISNGRTSQLKFFSGGNVQFVFQQNGKPVERLLDPSWFKSAEFNGNKYISVPFKEALAIKLKKQSQIFQVIEQGDRISLYKMYRFYIERGEADPTELIAQKKGEDPISLDVLNPRFLNWKKAFAKYFADCSVLSAQIQVGEYKRNDERILAAIRAYNKNECE